MEYLDIILTILSVVAPVAGGTAAVYIKKALFLGKAAQQAVKTFEQVKDRNQEIYDMVRQDENRKELAQVLEGAVKKINGLPNIQI